MLDNTFYDILIDIIGFPQTTEMRIILYVVACFVFVLCCKFMYDFITNIFGLR